jgi:hypothetical protein
MHGRCWWRPPLLAIFLFDGSLLLQVGSGGKLESRRVDMACAGGGLFLPTTTSSSCRWWPYYGCGGAFVGRGRGGTLVGRGRCSDGEVSGCWWGGGRRGGAVAAARDTGGAGLEGDIMGLGPGLLGGIGGPQGLNADGACGRHGTPRVKRNRGKVRIGVGDDVDR